MDSLFNPRMGVVGSFTCPECNLHQKMRPGKSTKNVFGDRVLVECSRCRAVIDEVIKP